MIAGTIWRRVDPRAAEPIAADEKGRDRLSCSEVVEHFPVRIVQFGPALRAFAEVDSAGARGLPLRFRRRS